MGTFYWIFAAGSSSSMDVTMISVNVAFFLLLMAWLLVDMWKQRKQGGDLQLPNRVREGKLTVFNKITLLANLIISISYLAFCCYNFRRRSRIINLEPVISLITWTLASVVAAYSLSRNFIEQKRWPSVLVLWWVFSAIFGSLVVTLHIIITHFKSTRFPNFLPKANLVDITSLPLSILLCFNAVPISSTSVNRYNENEQQLLQECVEDVSSHSDDAFSNAGIWSLVTFQWLNPLFKKGRTQKLELPDIPSFPQSETAAKASSLLEESLQKQKTRASSLPNALIHAIWRPLAINAIFAGNCCGFFFFLRSGWVIGIYCT